MLTIVGVVMVAWLGVALLLVLAFVKLRGRQPQAQAQAQVHRIPEQRRSESEVSPSDQHLLG